MIFRSRFSVAFLSSLADIATENKSRRQPSSLDKSQGYHKEARLLRWDKESQTIVRL